MDRGGWRKVIGTAQEWGLNHLRFHSWCPPEAAFEVADSAGFYLQVELPLWALEVGKDPATVDFLNAEADRILRTYGNHPSFCLMSMGNELQGDMQLLNRLMKRLKAADNRHLYTTTTFTFEEGYGTHPMDEDDFFITQWTRNGWVRGQGVFEEQPPRFDRDYRTAVEGIGVPLITHEIGQYSVYPNLSEIPKYTGVLRPLNFEAVRDDLNRKGLLPKAADYTEASGRLSAILYKEEIERALPPPASVVSSSSTCTTFRGRELPWWDSSMPFGRVKDSLAPKSFGNLAPLWFRLSAIPRRLIPEENTLLPISTCATIHLRSSKIEPCAGVCKSPIRVKNWSRNALRQQFNRDIMPA